MSRWGMTPVSPVSISLALPDQIVSNEQLCEAIDTTPEWIESRTGIRQRRYLTPDEGINELAVSAARRALESAALEPQDVDVLIVACSTPEWIFPAFSVMLGQELGITTPRVMDITQQACSSSVYATYLAACMLQEEGLQSALIVCAEAASRVMDPENRTTRIFFGDAAAAMVLRKVESDGLLSYDLGNDCSDAVTMAGHSLLRREFEGHGRELHDQYFQMDGKSVMRAALERVPDSIRACLQFAGVDASEVDGFALHQANVRILEKVATALDIDSDKMAVTADEIGNTGAASPLTALWKLAKEGQAKRGNLVVLGAIGAGFMWGTLCFRLSDDIKWGE